MILSNVLEMNINKYLNYVDRFITMTANAPFYRICHIDERILTKRLKGITGIVVKEDDEFRFHVPRYVKLHFELLHEPNNIKWKHQMNWIGTRNLFLHHVMTHLLALQRNFWESQDYRTMVTVSLKEFLEEYPFPYLDISRLSRLLNNTRISSNGTEYFLRQFFWSRKKVYACIVENVISQQTNRMKDREIQALLKRDYDMDLSVRTICNYRKSLRIPAYNKNNQSNSYDNYFSKALVLNKKSLSLIPPKGGVYEISINKDIKYQKFASRVIYFGRSKNLRRRIQSYMHNNIKNPIIKYYKEGQGLFIRYFTTLRYDHIEKELLLQFQDKFVSLPVANKLSMKNTSVQIKEDLI